MAVEKGLTPLGGDVRRIRVGHTFRAREATKQNACLGLERRGHMVLPEYFLFDDAMLIPLRMAELLSRTDAQLSKLVDSIPMFPKRTINFSCPDEYKFKVIESLQKSFSETYKNVNVMDGVRVDTDEGWALMRCSNTEPTIRMTAEASSDDVLNELVEKFENILKSEIEKFENKK
jgi:phosphomannomutase